MVVYGAFKGMGDFICAAPAIKAELQSGSEVTVLVFPQAAPIIELLDFGVHGERLFACKLPAKRDGISIREFLSAMSRLSPTSVYISPHAPSVVASWKIPLLLWVLKKLYWPAGTLIGATSEPFAWIFGNRIPVSRHLPYGRREWAFYKASRPDLIGVAAPKITFKASISSLRQERADYDLAILPGAGTENRKWPFEHYATLVNELPPAYRIAVVGVPGDVATLRSTLPGDRIITFLSDTLERAIASVARSRVALTMDSGSMFFAQVLGVPTIALFGPSDPENVIATSSILNPLYVREWSCQPCRRGTCSQRRVYCMGSISPVAVAKAIVGMVSSTSRMPG